MSVWLCRQVFERGGSRVLLRLLPRLLPALPRDNHARRGNHHACRDNDHEGGVQDDDLAWRLLRSERRRRRCRAVGGLAVGVRWSRRGVLAGTLAAVGPMLRQLRETHVRERPHARHSFGVHASPWKSIGITTTTRSF